MKVLIVHLSDMHFLEEESFTENNVRAIINSLSDSIHNIYGILIIATGDLTYAGKSRQFEAVSSFFRELEEGIKKKYSIKKIDFVVVPGNHDVDYDVGNGDIKNSGLKEVCKNNSYDDILKYELMKLEEFYSFASKYNCFQNKRIVEQKVIEYEDFKININLINTAIFSSKDDDRGYHFLRNEDINMISNSGEYDFIFSIMHHPHSWFNPRVKEILEKDLIKKSDLIFLGHVHKKRILTIEEDESTVDVVRGGKLSDQGTWRESVFNVGILDLRTRELVVGEYMLESNNMASYNDKNSQEECIYTCQKTEVKDLSKNRFNPLGFTALTDYMVHQIYQDRLMVSDNCMDYFVFPLLVEKRDDKKDDSLHEISDMNSFVKKLEFEKRVIVYGLDDSGKTTLAKAVFCEFLSEKIVVLINGSEVVGDYEKTIRHAFESIYGRDRIKYEQFKQAEKLDLMLIVDDFDMIEENCKESFIDYISNRFGFVLEIHQQGIEIDIESRLRKKCNNEGHIIYTIEPFYLDKRRELVTKVVDIIGTDGQNKDAMIALLCDSLSKQKSLYNWSPFFIVQFTKYYYKNIGEASKNDGNVFSTVFENNLTLLIEPYINSNITIQKIKIILDKIAYVIYKNKEYPISTERICKIINEYNDKYDEDVNDFQLIDTLKKAKIIKHAKKGFLFYERSYLSYFVAREIRRLIYEGDFEDIKHVMEFCYMHINADILLFVTYITDNIYIIRTLMEMAELSVKKWDEFSLSPIKISYMNETTNDSLVNTIKPVDEDDRIKEEQSKLEVEKNESRYLSVRNDASIFEGESKELNLTQEMMRSISLMITLARALPSFEHLMEKKDKKRCVGLIYTMPLKIFNAWAEEVDVEKKDLIQMIKEFHEWEYRKDKLDKESLTDQDALTMLRWDSISLLLELMNVAMNYATKDNTWRYIDAFSIEKVPTYNLEHLMGLQYMDDVSGFINSAIALFQNERIWQNKMMIQRVSRKYMVTSRKIDFKNIQKLNSKLFENQLKHNNILFEQKHNKKKK